MTLVIHLLFYLDIYKYYNILKKYIEKKGLVVTGDIHEIYHIEIHITENEDEFITEIQIPVAEQQK